VTPPRVARTLDLTSSEEECGDTALALVRRTIKELAAGEVLEVQSTVAEHAFVVRAWARKTGRPIVEDRTEGKRTTILVQQTANG
jgi:TusA-related sulfurtransferase